MIDDTQLEHWKTKAEASEILKCSEKTISRLAAQKRIQQLMRRNPGRRAQPVFSPDDIEALRGSGGALFDQEILSNVVDGAGQAARCSISSPSLNFFPSKTWTISSEPLSLRQRTSA